MLASYLQRPTPNLPFDPGPGNARLSLSLPARAVKVVSALLGESESVALRRIIASNIGTLPAVRSVSAVPYRVEPPRLLVSSKPAWMLDIMPVRSAPLNLSRPVPGFSGTQDDWNAMDRGAKEWYWKEAGAPVDPGPLESEEETGEPLKSSRAMARPQLQDNLGASIIAFVLELGLVFLGIVLACKFFARRFASGGETAPSTTRFIAWGPKR